MQIIIHPGGTARCVYDELIDVARLGHVDIRRASHVEPDDNGKWLADLSPNCGPVLGPFAMRSDALSAELTWLEQNWLPVHEADIPTDSP